MYTMLCMYTVHLSLIGSVPCKPPFSIIKSKTENEFHCYITRLATNHIAIGSHRAWSTVAHCQFTGKSRAPRCSM